MFSFCHKAISGSPKEWCTVDWEQISTFSRTTQRMFCGDAFKRNLKVSKEQRCTEYYPWLLQGTSMSRNSIPLNLFIYLLSLRSNFWARPLAFLHGVGASWKNLVVSHGKQDLGLAKLKIHGSCFSAYFLISQAIILPIQKNITLGYYFQGAVVLPGMKTSMNKGKEKCVVYVYLAGKITSKNTNFSPCKTDDLPTTYGLFFHLGCGGGKELF